MSILNVSDAMDVIDTYGPDADLWPVSKRADLESLIASDEEFSSYVDDARRIDDMLSDWTWQSDGAQINLDELDDEEDPDQEDQDDLEPEDDDEASGGPAFPGGATPPPGGGFSFPEADDEEEEGDQPDPAEEEEDQQPIITIDMDDVHADDVDQMLAAIIRQSVAANPDEKYNVFTRDYDRIVELDPPRTESLEGIDQTVSKAVGPLMKDLRRMIAARSQVKRTPGMRRGKLHAPNLHRIMAGDDRVFTRREEASSLDTAISIVLDNSGSMSGTRLRVSAEACYALGTVLNKLGIAFECLGFTTMPDNLLPDEVRSQSYHKEVVEASKAVPYHRIHPIIMPKFKAFDERWTPDVQRRFAFIHNNRGGKLARKIELGYTPEGCGTEFAARRLLQRKEARKIMMVMTDGEPYCPSFTYADGIDKVHAQRMVQMISAAGIDLIGIGICHSGPTKYYPNSMVINSVEEMPLQLLGLLKRLLLGN